MTHLYLFFGWFSLGWMISRLVQKLRPAKPALPMFAPDDRVWYTYTDEYQKALLAAGVVVDAGSDFYVVEWKEKSGFDITRTHRTMLTAKLAATALRPRLSDIPEVVAPALTPSRFSIL